MLASSSPPYFSASILRNDQLAVHLKARRLPFQGVQHVLRPQCGLPALSKLPDYFLLVGYVALAFGDVPIGLFALLVCHRCALSAAYAAMHSGSQSAASCPVLT